MDDRLKDKLSKQKMLRLSNINLERIATIDNLKSIRGAIATSNLNNPKKLSRKKNNSIQLTK